MNPKPNAEEYFTVDKGVGNGYDVYYRKKHGCYYYTVTTNDNGSLMYSHAQRVPREVFDQLKENNESI